MYVKVSLKLPGFIETEGYEGVSYKFMRAVPNSTIQNLQTFGNTTCGIPPDNSFEMVRPADDPDYPWPGMFFGATISSLWYWCSDQV